MRNIQELKETTNRRINRLIEHEYVLGCSRCPPHRGCNRFYRGAWQNNWKIFRKTQWRVAE